MPLRRGPLLRLTSLLLLLGLAGCQTTAYRSDRLYRFFDEIVYGGPLDAMLDRDRNLTRWEEPLRVFIIEDETPERRAVIVGHLATFQRVTGLSAGMVEDHADANITVAFKPNKDFLANSEYVPCFVRTRWRGGRMASATIQISVAEPDMIDACIAHELMHTFGFGNHSGVVSSTLSPLHSIDTLSEWDELALRILYHPSVEVGMTRQEAGPVVRRLIPELMEE